MAGRSRTMARLATGGVMLTLALAMVAVPASAAGPKCTYSFPDGGGVYAKTVVAGDVLCGGPRRDEVRLMEGGIFMGRRGQDRVRRMEGGKFKGGPRTDLVGLMNGGTFIGGDADDYIVSGWIRPGTMTGGTFRGGRDGDWVGSLLGGTYDGGPGFDGVESCAVSPPAVIIDVERVESGDCPP
jgi:hypothetical protein